MAYTAEESARRLRALWGWSMLEQRDFVAQLTDDQERGKRMLRRSGATKATQAELERAAEIAGMPRSFALQGVAAIAVDAPDLAERLEAVEGKVDALLAALRAARDQGAGQLGDDLVALFAEHSPSRSTPPGSDPPAAPTPETEDSHPAPPARAAARS